MAKTKLFQKAEFQSAYLKAGILGFAGSGKTYTATSLAIGLHELIKSQKPICFMDTETGSDFMIRRFADKKIKLLVSKSRSFTEMLALIDEAEQISDILILDSISAVWYDFMESFKKKKGRKFIQFQDWGILKPTWRDEFTDKRYLNSQLHIIICGRAGYEYEYEADEDGRKELHKTGTKMRAESEFGYEPSLLIEMVREKTDNKGKMELNHKCFIIKDRGDVLTGREFDNPTFKDLLPSIEILNFGGKHKGIDLEKDSQDAFDDTGQTDWSKERKMRVVTLDEIKTELSYAFPSTSGADKIAKLEILEKIFGTKSWTAIEEQEKEFNSDVLKEGLGHIIVEIKARKEGLKREDLNKQFVDTYTELKSKDIPGKPQKAMVETFKEEALKELKGLADDQVEIRLKEMKESLK